MAAVVECYLLIRPEKISWLRFIFEGYDGLAIVSTLAAKQGLVRIQTLDCRFAETMRLVEALAPTLTPYPSRCLETVPSTSGNYE
nr:DUF4911 domain-containing protein [uncultured Desulfobulbus sp.]